MAIQKKICMLGAFGVGKTSLVNSYLKGTFSPNYDTTVGVRIDLKPLRTPSGEFNLVIWDIAGEDEFQRTPPSYLVGSAGYILVADVTRRSSFTRAIDIQKYAEERLGRLPFVFVLNKFDLTDDWEIDRDLLDRLVKRNWVILESSAKTGMGVEAVFQVLAQQILENPNGSLPLTDS